MVLWLAVILYGMWQHRTNRYYTISLISKRQLSYLRNNQNARDSLLESGNYFRQFIFIGFLLARAKQQESAKKAKWMKYIHRSTAESGYRVTTIHFTVYQRHNNIMKIKKVVTVVIVEFHYTNSFYAGFVFFYLWRIQNRNGMRTQKSFFLLMIWWSWISFLTFFRISRAETLLILV